MVFLFLGNLSGGFGNFMSQPNFQIGIRLKYFGIKAQHQQQTSKRKVKRHEHA